jgi:hypothetical protein
MRTHPAHPGSLERSRTNTPRRLIAAVKAACLGPILARTKFASLGQE